VNISVLILTLNEEVNLQACLQSARWSDDIVVFDSFSSDRTVEIAWAAGARVVQRAFDNYASQRNHALRDVAFRNAWVYMLDADERIPDDLRAEMLSAVTAAPEEVTVFRLRRKDFLFGRWLRRSSGYPTWAARLFRAGHVWVEREINEQVTTTGETAALAGHFVHLPFNSGIAHWFHRHNRYSSMEAVSLLQEIGQPLCWRGLFIRDPAVRRKHLKQLAYRLPGRPLLVFAYLYVARLGLLDGLPGLHYCLLRTIYEYMINLKAKELRRRRAGLAV
jgi:hypothetical protein